MPNGFDFSQQIRAYIYNVRRGQGQEQDRGFDWTASWWRLAFGHPGITLSYNFILRKLSLGARTEVGLRVLA